ncbi:MAG: hypothetical protein GF405_01780, partial [Candidatus Eisenbacteria bacterium]|nr:hypothetical protein [Candidatus Eisenbacteria bacterium]
MSGAPRFAALVDLDGDGLDECIRVDQSADRMYWQWSVERLLETTRFPLLSERSVDRLGCAGLSDLDDDGTPEAALWRQDGERVLLTAVEVLIERANVGLDTVAVFEWYVGDGLLPNGVWRGELELAGTVDLDMDGADDAVVVLLQAGTLGRPRAVTLTDIASGEELWSVETGARPVGGAAIVDLESDGRSEIVVGLEPTSSPTLEGLWGDLESRVVVLDIDGLPRWSRATGGAGSTVAMAAADLTGDGAMEIVVGTYRADSGDAPGVMVLDASGDTVAEALNGVSVHDLAPTGRDLYLACGDGAIRRFALDDGSLVIEAELHVGDEVRRVGTVSMSPPLHDEGIYFAGSMGAIGVAARDLKPLALLRTTEAGPGPGSPFAAGTFADENGSRSGLAASTADRLRFLVLRRRAMSPALLLAVFAAAGIGIVMVVPRSRRTTLSWVREHITPVQERGEIIDGILQDLRTGGHGKLSITRPVRHLADNLRMLGDQEGGITDSFARRYREMVEKAQGDGVASIDRIRRNAERVGLAPEAAAALRDVVGELRRALAGIGSEIPPEPECVRLADRL